MQSTSLPIQSCATKLYSSANDEDASTNNPIDVLLEIPELNELLQSRKMRECMELLVSGGQEALEQKMKEDKEVEEMAMMLMQIMSGATPSAK